MFDRPHHPDHPPPFPTSPSPRSQVLHPSESPRANPATPGDEESERLKHLNDCQTMVSDGTGTGRWRVTAPAPAPADESAQGTPATPSEVESRRLKHLNDPQTQDQEALLRVIVSELGFDSSRPVVACVTYKALLHWRSFEAERTSVFDRIIQTI
ncbi:unnamed protein product [Closterium sp. NIES-64]|nr:unnamed protein product [Closterium sp. NIES-64]